MKVGFLSASLDHLTATDLQGKVLSLCAKALSTFPGYTTKSLLFSQRYDMMQVF